MSWLGDMVFEASGSLSKASQSVKLNVDQNNVMQAARIVQAEALHFGGRVMYWARLMDEARPMGGDPVSEELNRVLGLKLFGGDDSYVNRCFEYVGMLEGLAEQLRQAALTYGFTEEQVTAQFAAAKLDAGSRPSPRAQSWYGERRAI